MPTVAETPFMAEPKSKPARIRPDLHAKLKVIEAASEITGEPFNTIEYLDPLIRPTIDADYEKAIEVLSKNRRKKSP